PWAALFHCVCELGRLDVSPPQTHGSNYLLAQRLQLRRRSVVRSAAYRHNFPPWRKHESQHSMDVGEIALCGAEIGDKSRISIQRSAAKVGSDPRFSRHPDIVFQIIVRLLL